MVDAGSGQVGLRSLNPTVNMDAPAAVDRATIRPVASVVRRILSEDWLPLEADQHGHGDDLIVTHVGERINLRFHEGIIYPDVFPDIPQSPLAAGTPRSQRRNYFQPLIDTFM
jgi:hypothetical protein